ncbi:MAG TPA: type II toxin-antitoxin system HipA family toxin [Pseudolysinimonas sp.]|nr:type II toxin-antitoxin system HipA family toxin [Pseudolysinimonas sp.]
MVYTAVDLVEVRIWGRRVGAIAGIGAGAVRGAYAFEYDPAWIVSGLDLAPVLMPRARRTYVFPDLSPETFQGLPPMIADSLPDKFGNAIVTSWLTREGVSPAQITGLDRLAYLGARGLGALEFIPDRAPAHPRPTALDLSQLVTAARSAVHGSLATEAESEIALRRIIEVGTSAGGARAKAIVNVNTETGELRSGQLLPEPGFESWLLKFDGIGVDRDLGATADYGRIEFAYSLMAQAAGITVPETRLLHENGRAHFMTRRFDRAADGSKVHLQTLCAMDGLDFNQIGVHDYAQYLRRVVELGLGTEALVEAFRRMAFNVATSNCDDHTKNFSFLMEPSGQWSLAPAYDLTYAHSPTSQWTSQHLMSVNGKFSDIARSDLLAVADRFEVPGAVGVIDAVVEAAAEWQTFATAADLPTSATERIAADFPLDALRRRRTRAKGAQRADRLGG